MRMKRIQSEMIPPLWIRIQIEETHLKARRLTVRFLLCVKKIRIVNPSVDDAVPPPACTDVIFEFPDDSKYLPGNTVVIRRGATISIACIALRLEEFPRWAAPNPQIVSVRSLQLYSLYVIELHISNISEEHNGQYECYRSSFQKKVFNIQANVPTTNCSKFEEREFHVHYDKLQAANSSASFSFKDTNKKLVGRAHLLA
ncbi:uncharacterized protein CEXT_399921 [Caerostris extrusa]|uniref:Ig-like domain-containing protein n=1 Tax=Caerostris extrusa TaxID=172846 RepID=A0AAV4UUS5_CAEEX|nr:uncharacterized protein CEXT_399921 [Caerostris extrusa]